MRMLSGAAISHLAIAFERTEDGLRMFRPLLPYSHEELCAMLRGEGLVWSEDSTNTDEKIARNQMRHSLLPALCARYAELPELLDAVARFSQMLRAFIEKRIAGFNPALPLERNEFLALVPLARDELLYRYLGRGGRVPFRWVCRIRLLLEQGPSSWEERFGSQRVWCDDGLMHVGEIPKLQSFCYWGDCLRQGGVVSIPSLGCLHVRPWHEGDPEAWIRLDPQKLKRPVLRNAREGDRIELAGKMTGISHLVSGWKLQRPYATVPLLEDQGGIVAVFGSAVGGRDRIASPCKSLAPRNLFVYYWD